MDTILVDPVSREVVAGDARMSPDDALARAAELFHADPESSARLVTAYNVATARERSGESAQ